MPKQKANATPSVRQTSPSKSFINNNKPKIKPRSIKTSKQVVDENKQVIKSERLRNFLDKNKIYFETLTATTLTLMAIVVAVAQLLVTNKQTAYLEQQTIIGRSQALPHFVVTAKQYMNEDNTLAVSDKILIYNQGNLAYNITTQTAVFFELSYLKETDIRNQRIPVSGYYTVSGELRHNQSYLLHVSLMLLQNNFFSVIDQQTLAGFLFQQHRIRKNDL